MTDQTILDRLVEFTEEHSLVGCGLLLLLAAFLGSFLLKTAWNTWDNRNAREKYDRHGHRVKGKEAVCRTCLNVRPVEKMRGSAQVGYTCRKCEKAARKARGEEGKESSSRVDKWTSRTETRRMGCLRLRVKVLQGR